MAYKKSIINTDNKLRNPMKFYWDTQYIQVDILHTCKKMDTTNHHHNFEGTSHTQHSYNSKRMNTNFRQQCSFCFPCPGSLPGTFQKICFFIF